MTENNRRLSGAMAALLIAAASIAAASDPTALTDVGARAVASVDPFIGTGGEGHTFPGAVVPFGMVQLSPDTRIQPRNKAYGWAAGYRHDDTSIVGFSHTHFSGTGHSDLGDVLLMPIAGDVRLERGDPEKPGSGYTSRFGHDNERGEPGYYAVTLDDYDVRAELTASARVGMHRYSFPAGKPAHVLLDLRTSMYDYPGKVSWSRIRVRSDGTVTGFRETRGWAPGRQLHFAMRFSQPLSGHALHNAEQDIVYKGFPPPGHEIPAARAQIEGRQLVASFDFGDAKDAPLLVKVSISPVSEDSAIANLDAEAPGWDFDGMRVAAKGHWAQALGAVEIDAPESMRKAFYTALYHAFQGPSLFMDSDGRYRGPDNAVHQAQGFTHYSTFSLWDTYRALHPLLTLLQPEQRNIDFVNSLLAAQKQSPYGVLPVWAFHGLETWCMIGYHAVPVIADAYLKGIRGFDADAARRRHDRERQLWSIRWTPPLLELGYVPIDEEGEAASKTLEYAYDDWTIARMAAAIGRKDVAATFGKRAGNWKHAFDADTGLMRARTRDGRFRVPFDPDASGYGTDYTEGNAWQYSWYVPQDVAALAAAHGGAAKLLARLDDVFDATVDPSVSEHMEAITGLIGWYAHGNEPIPHVRLSYPTPDNPGAPRRG